MATDYFAHAAYGVPVEGPARAALEALVEACEADFYAALVENPDQDPPDLGEWARTRYPDRYAAVLALAGAPPDASLIYTGDEDDRPGRCATESGCWLAGYGVLSFPRAVGAFTGEPAWHTWVTAG